MKKLLIIGHTFPEPTTTAAGSRMMQLISLFQEQNFEITFASTALVSEKSEVLPNLKIKTTSIELNNANFDDFILALNPSVVLFDRFITEEQFAWRIAEKCPKALRILDTEDLHFLRKARKEAIKKGMTVEKANLFSETAKREIASILRCDLSLIISEYEMELLQKTFYINHSILQYLPFLVKSISGETKSKLPKFEDRNHFISIGNLLHQPNVDSILYLKKEIWPRIRTQIPKAALHIYGNYAPQQITQLHNKKERFLIKGWAADASEVMKKARVCLAPLRFGAGLKGKLITAMSNGTPSVTTTIGAEGMSGNLPFSGVICDAVDAIVKASVELYSDKKKWQDVQNNGFAILENRFQRTLFSEGFFTRINYLQYHIEQHRNSNFIGQLLQHQSLQASKYMSKWIEEKNKL